MINNVYRLVEEKLFQQALVDEPLGPDTVIVRPLYLSICAADQRYYQGLRSERVMREKLPMALIHEASGRVVFDPKQEFKVGESVVLIANEPREEDDLVKENYRLSSRFRSSTVDGFMQELVFINRDRIVSCSGIDEALASMTELLSVAVNAYKSFLKHSHTKNDRIGIWGAGSLGFMVALVLKTKLPEAALVLFSTHSKKMDAFQMVDEKHYIDDNLKGISVDHCFECVGGLNSRNALDQMIDVINPEGVINLLGVSEEPVPVNTRMVLEKGITLVGESRSGKDDYLDAIDIIRQGPNQNYLRWLISDIIAVKGIEDIDRAFKEDVLNSFKTLMKWEV